MNNTSRQLVGADSPVAQRQSQVVEQIERLTGFEAALGEEVKRLNAKLEPITRVEPPTAEDPATKPSPEMLVPLADRLNELTNRLCYLLTQLEALRRRIEL